MAGMCRVHQGHLFFWIHPCFRSAHGLGVTLGHLEVWGFHTNNPSHVTTDMMRIHTWKGLLLQMITLNVTILLQICKEGGMRQRRG